MISFQQTVQIKIQNARKIRRQRQVSDFKGLIGRGDDKCLDVWMELLEWLWCLGSLRPKNKQRIFIACKALLCYYTKKFRTPQ
jgi:hypothetical protein